MAVSASITAICQAAILKLADLGTFQTAYNAVIGASSDNKLAAWRLCFDVSVQQVGTHSPAYRLKRAIREAIRGNDDGTLSPTDRETLYQSLVSLYVPSMTRPNMPEQDQVEYTALAMQNLATGE